MHEVFPEAWTTAIELLGVAGLWGIGGSVLGLAAALLAAPVAARWTGGGRAAGCAWALLLMAGLVGGGLYGGATYGIAQQGERLVREEWLLERLAATALLEVAEQRGLDGGGATAIGPKLSEARERLETRIAESRFPVSAISELRLSQLVSSVLDAVEEIDRLGADDLRALRFDVGRRRTGEEREARLSKPARDLIATTAPIRDHAAAAIWGGALPHLVAAGAIAGAPVALVIVIGTISSLSRRRRRSA